MPLLHGTTRVKQPNTGEPGPELSCALSSPFPFASSARAERGSEARNTGEACTRFSIPWLKVEAVWGFQILVPSPDPFSLG